MVHGHEVLQMMQGKQYATKEELLKEINKQFGTDTLFRTCHAEGLTAGELVDFFEAHGKFMPAGNRSFTVNLDKVCHH